MLEYIKTFTSGLSIVKALSGLPNKAIAIGLLVIAILVGVIYFGNWREDVGYDKAKLEYTESARTNLETVTTTMQSEIDQLKAKNLASQSAKNEAEQKALKARTDADTYYRKVQELSRHVPLTPPSQIDNPYPFSVGFVGLFNLSVKGTPTAGAVGSPDLLAIAEASGIDIGPAGADLAATAKVKVDDVLFVSRENFKIANTCLAERKIVKEYLDKLCTITPCAD